MQIKYQTNTVYNLVEAEKTAIIIFLINIESCFFHVGTLSVGFFPVMFMSGFLSFYFFLHSKKNVHIYSVQKLF